MQAEATKLAIGKCGERGEGPYAVFTLQLEGDLIRQSRCETHGCPSSMACAQIAARLVTGRTTEQAELLTASDLEKVLGGLPPGKGRNAEMVIEALQRALEVPCE